MVATTCLGPRSEDRRACHARSSEKRSNATEGSSRRSPALCGRVSFAGPEQETGSLVEYVVEYDMERDRAERIDLAAEVSAIKPTCVAARGGSWIDDADL